MEIELNNEQTTPSQQQEQRKASHDLAAARLVKISVQLSQTCVHRRYSTQQISCRSELSTIQTHWIFSVPGVRDSFNYVHLCFYLLYTLTLPVKIFYVAYSCIEG